MVCEEITKEVTCSVYVPQVRTRTYTVCRYECVPEQKTETYTVLKPVQVKVQVPVRVCKMVEKEIEVPVCTGCYCCCN